MFRFVPRSVPVAMLLLGSACSHAPAPVPSSKADAVGNADASTLDAIDTDTSLATSQDVGSVDSADSAAVDVSGDASVPVDTAGDATSDALPGDAVVAGDVPGDTSATVDAGEVQDTGTVQDAAADALPLPTADTATASCKDKRQKGDGKTWWCQCWDPPEHYCSGMEGAMPWFGCSPDQKACAEFDIFCHPCGWTPCPIVSKNSPPPKLPPGCPKYFVYPQAPGPIPPEVQPYVPTDKVFCWDGAPPEWKTLDFHAKDAGPPMP
jgi:hypothetical protein